MEQGDNSTIQGKYIRIGTWNVEYARNARNVDRLGVWAAEVFQRTQRWLLAAKIRLDGGERVYQRLGRW